MNKPKNKTKTKDNKKDKSKLKNSKIIKSMKKTFSKINFGKNRFNTSELILVFIMALIIGILIGEIIFSNNNMPLYLNQNNKKEMAEIENVYNTLLEEYLNKVDKKTLKEAAINGMIGTLEDAHSSYYSDDELKDFQDELNGYFYGIGAEVYQEEGDLVTILNIYKSSPAEKAGLKVGDRYLKINGEDVSKLKADEIAKKIKGAENKTISITVQRDGKEVTTKVTTAKVEIPSVSSDIIKRDNQNIGYICLSIFSGTADEQFSKALKELENKNIDKLIIDLRGNEGGQLETVINIASKLLDRKTPILQIESKTKKDIKYALKGKEKDHKIVVLINESSASASEVLAAALNEQLDSELVGMPTYGKGTVQKTKTVSSESLIKYTTETWKTSKGKNIEGKGVTPTIKVKQNEKYYDTNNIEDDTQLQKAIEVILTK